MQSYTCALNIGFMFVLVPLYAVKNEHNEAFTSRSRGSSNAIAVALSVFDQSPTDSPKEPRTPDILAPQAIGFFECEEREEALNDEETLRENDHNVIFLDVTHNQEELSDQGQTQAGPKACSHRPSHYLRTPKNKPSRADNDQNWRKKKLSEATRDEIAVLEATKTADPKVENTLNEVSSGIVNLITSQQGHKNRFISFSEQGNEDQSLVVVATAATLHDRQKSSNRFACLSEQEG